VGATEAELKQEAGRQRDRMSSTLDAIGDRISPERMIEHRKAAVGERWQRMRTAVMGSPDHEERGYLGSAKESFTSSARSAVETARSAAEHVQHAPDAVADQTRGNPMAAGLVAFGLGMLVATVLPKLQTEQHVVEEAAPQLRQAVSGLRDAANRWRATRASTPSKPPTR
jgi:hypothetical protein